MKYNPNMNSKIINPLTVTKPKYKDSDIEDMYYEEDENGKPCVVIVARFTADMVRKYRCPFDSKQQAISFINEQIDGKADAESSIKSKIAAATPTTPPQEEKTECEENKHDKAATFSFGDDNYVNSKANVIEKPQAHEEKPKAHFEFADNEEVSFKREMEKLKNIPVHTQETGTGRPAKFGNVKIGNGIL